MAKLNVEANEPVLIKDGLGIAEINACEIDVEVIAVVGKRDVIVELIFVISGLKVVLSPFFVLRQDAGRIDEHIGPAACSRTCCIVVNYGSFGCTYPYIVLMFQYRILVAFYHERILVAVPDQAEIF